MRTMYDALIASNIPGNAAMVAGYVDGEAWSDADWAMFTNAVKVRISAIGTNDGHVLDVERGNLNAVQSVGWVRMRRAAGVDPTIYCGFNRDGYGYSDIVTAFNAADEPLPWFWFANDTGTANMVPGAIATQWAVDSQLHTGYDLSLVVEYWPGVDPIPSTEDDDDMDRLILTGYPNPTPQGQVLINLDRGWKYSVPDASSMDSLMQLTGIRQIEACEVSKAFVDGLPTVGSVKV